MLSLTPMATMRRFISPEHASPSSFGDGYHARVGSNNRSLCPASVVSITTNEETIMSDVYSRQSHEEVRYNNMDHRTSTWQEEAHWMSFRQAIRSFVSSREENKSNESNEEDELTTQDVHFEVPCPETSQAAYPPLQPNSDKESPSALASHLAETKMRLALAQAERDELEFALLQKHTP